MLHNGRDAVCAVVNNDNVTQMSRRAVHTSRLTNIITLISLLKVLTSRTYLGFIKYKKAVSE